MKIVNVNCTPFSIPYRFSKSFGRSTAVSTEHVLIEVQTDEGLVGTAEAISRPMFYGESQGSILAALREWFIPLLVGMDPFETDRLHQHLRRVQGNHTVKAALDIALHDIIGQACGKSCRALLGGWASELTLTYICGLGDPSAMAEEASAMHERYGFSSFKLKCGLSVKVDRETIKLVRRALPDALLYIDCNQGLRGSDAQNLLRYAEEFDIAWAEEPCATEDRRGRRMAADSPIPILGDESCRDLFEVAREIRDSNVDLIGVKIARTGFTDSSKILGMCEANGLRALCGTQGETGVGMAALWHFATAHSATQLMPAETFLLELEDDIIAEPHVIANGKLILPERPGLGVEIDRKKLERFQVR